MDRTEWLAERRRIPAVGSSEAAALFGLHENLSAFALFEQLMNPRELTEEEEEEATDVRAFGLSIEPYLSQFYERKTKRKTVAPSQAIYRLKDKPLFASPDRLWLKEDGQPGGVVELKSAIYFDPSQSLKDQWQIQAQAQCLCTGLPSASFAILGGFRRRYHIDDIPANPSFHSILIARIELFMLSVQEGTWGRFESELDGKHSTTEALRRLYPQEDGTAIRLPAEATRWADELERIELDLKELEESKDKLRNMLRFEMKEHTFGILESGEGFSNKLQKGSTYTVTREPTRVLRRIKKIPKGLLGQ